jgi:serine/threonine protein kinase
VSTGPKHASGRRKRCPACKQEFEGVESICRYDGTILILVTENLVGTTLAGKYEVLSEIDRGGMSIVYKAKHQLMDRIVAIKVLQSQLVNDQTSKKRFQQEAQAASCLTHPNVIGIYDFGIAESTAQPYIVMDYLVGDSLAKIVKQDNHLEERRAVRVFLQACDALEHAHKKGVLHRDLKSSNIMLVEIEGKRDIVKVVDFGIAKFMPSSGKQPQNLTQTGEIFGSPIYMSPEQCVGQNLDSRSDIYSMGVLMYEALTGLPPLLGDTIVDTMQMHVSTKPSTFQEIRPDLRIPKELESVVLKALEKSPNARFQSMQEFYDALELVAYSMGITDRDTGWLRDTQGRITRQTLAAPVSDHTAIPSAAISSKQYSASRFNKKTATQLSQSASNNPVLKSEANNGSQTSDEDDEIAIRLPKDKRILAAAAICVVLVVAAMLWFAVHH